MGFDDTLEGNGRDLEFGGVRLSRRMRKVLIFINANRTKLVRLAFLLAMATVLIAIKLALRNVDSVVSTVDSITETITLDEKTYTPFILSEEPSSLSSIKFPPNVLLKSTAMNRKMQIINLDVARERVGEHLRRNELHCMPLLYFGVDLNIMVLWDERKEEATILVNPSIRSTSEHYRNEQVETLDGKKEWAKLPLHVSVDYVNGDLRAVESERFDDDLASCIWYYTNEMRKNS